MIKRNFQTKGKAWIALVADAYGGRGGIAQYNRDFLGFLARNDSISSIVVLPRLAPDSPTAPAKITQTRARKNKIFYSIAATITVLTHPAEVVFCGHLFMAPLAALLAKLKGAQFVLQTHGIEAWPDPGGFQRTAVDVADVVLCVSRFTRSRVLRWSTISPERVIVIPNTVSEKYVPGDAINLRKSLGLIGKRILLTVARMDASQQYKGHESVIMAIPELVKAGHDVVYLIAGEGDDRSRLEQLAIAAAVKDRVVFLGPVPPTELPEIYRLADIYVMPSTREGFGIAFLEAMACGLPTLGLGVAGACDALVDGALGTMASQSDFLIKLERMLCSSQQNAEALSEEVTRRFGRRAFETRLALALNRL